MKYNEELFNTSAEYYKKIEETEENEKTKEKQKELLPILLKKCKKALESDKSQNNGIVKIRFESRFWENPEDGYKLISELRKANQFDAFASQYGFYLGELCDECNEYQSAFIEVVWDYKAYFESLSMSLATLPEEGMPNVLSFEEVIREAKRGQASKKAEDLEDFAKNVAEYRNALASNSAVKLALN